MFVLLQMGFVGNIHYIIIIVSNPHQFIKGDFTNNNDISLSTERFHLFNLMALVGSIGDFMCNHDYAFIQIWKHARVHRSSFY